MVPPLLLPAPELGTQVMEVPAGATAMLRCNSNDDTHNFMFWQLGQNNIIGPGNDYDHTKYKYQVLSGKLFIKSVSPQETGYYRCISKDINEGKLNIGAVEMIVKEGGKLQQHVQKYEVPAEEADLTTVKIICIIISLIVLITCAVIFYKMKKAEDRRNARLVMFNEDEDDEGSGDEIYNRTTIINNSGGKSGRKASPTPGTSKIPVEDITGIDNQGLDTDFNSVFEQIAINTANRNLI